MTNSQNDTPVIAVGRKISRMIDQGFAGLQRRQLRNNNYRCAMNFTVGQKVVFVGTGKYICYLEAGFTVPVLDTVYTVRQVRPDDLHPDRIGLLLMEIRNPAIIRGLEPAFAAFEFRPLVERKTDISVFTKMLNTKHRELVT